MGISTSLEGFLQHRGGLPMFNPEEFNSSIGFIGIEGMKIRINKKSVCVVRLYWYQDKLFVEFEADLMNNPICIEEE